jgi:hypothetical protein
MGARPEQQLALNFLAAVHTLWIQHPGTYQVREATDDIVPALAQMCIKALASDVRDDDARAQEQQAHIDGVIMNGDRTIKGGIGQPQLTLRDALNKVIHGTPVSVEVRDSAVWLNFSNSLARESWTKASFSGTQLLGCLDRALYKHRTGQAEEREREIGQFLVGLGVARFLPGGTETPGAQITPLCIRLFARAEILTSMHIGGYARGGDAHISVSALRRPASLCMNIRATRLERCALMPHTARIALIGVILVRHSRCEDGYLSLLARRYRPHGHSDELSHVEHRSRYGRRHPRYRCCGTTDISAETRSSTAGASRACS